MKYQGKNSTKGSQSRVDDKDAFDDAYDNVFGNKPRGPLARARLREIQSFDEECSSSLPCEKCPMRHDCPEKYEI
jgi:hypothetical protein